MRRLALGFSLLLVSALTARADVLSDVLAKNLAARGGAHVHELQSLRLSGRAAFGIGDNTFELQWATLTARPGRIRTEATIQGLTQVRGYDGHAGWSVEPFQGRHDPQQLSADDVRSLAQDADLDGPLIDWQTKDRRIEYLGTEDVDGTQAIELRVTRKDGDVQYVYLDPDSWLEIRIRTVHHVRGAEEVTESDLGSYEQVGGVWIPFSIESGAKGEPRSLHITIERAEANVPVEDAWFHFPTGPVTRVIVAGPAPAHPEQAEPPPAPTGPVVVDSGTISGLGARNIGSAAMSGRVTSVAGVDIGGQTTVYVGAASGGVWRSLDGGTTFKPVFDKEPVQSIGAITIDPNNPKSVWVGTGESWTRNTVSIGNGIYHSTDGGETWSYAGLPSSERIVRILVDPHDSNTVFACVPGKLWSDSWDRGLYRTSDGGRSWQLVLKGPNPSTGCSGVTMDPRDPHVMLAGMWDFRRRAWTFRSGGDGPDAPSGSGMYRSTDGGRTWQPITTASGLPATPWGRVEVVYAPSDGRVVYALIESKDSALYRSDDGGRTWQQRDKSMKMVWRPFYFARLVVDPTNPNRVFKPDLGLIVSEDGGNSFADTANGAHGDWHDLWIDPKDPRHIIGGDDGGLWIAYDGGTHWHHAMNLPISQFYHVVVDNRDPYQVYGGLQDNSSWVGDSSYPGGVTNSRWTNLCNSDGFWVALDPNDPDAVYCEGQGGYAIWVDRKTMASRDIQPKPGYHEKLRFNWNTPLVASPTHRGTIYMGAQFLFRSRDRGMSWQRISPDLTTNDPAKQKQELSGGITVDNSAAEMNTTIFSISESPKNGSVIWVGTDDGNVQVTRDGGAHWTNVTGNVPGLPKATWVRRVEASPHDVATAYAVFDRHMDGDNRPYVFATHDFGKTWQRLVAPDARIWGWPHVIKEDPVKPGLLYLGTEFGLWISLDAGTHWARFEGGHFPAVAVRDLAFQTRDHDLVIATHGRGMWVVDDLTPLRALTGATLQKPTVFLPGRPVQQRMPASGGWVEGDATFVGQDPPNGLVVSYYLRTRHIYGPISLEVLDAQGKVIDTISPTKHRGINRVVWSMRVKPPRVPRAAQVAFNASQGPRVPPGTYTLRLMRGRDVIETKVTIGIDRRAPYTVADRKAQYAAVMRARALFGQMSTTVDRIAQTHEAVEARLAAVPPSDPLAGKLRALLAHLDAVKQEIVATKEGGAITGEERIREHLDTVYGALNGWEGRPAKYQTDRVDVLARELADATHELDTIAGKDARALDGELKAHKLDPIPVIAAPSAAHAELDERAMRCIASDGRDCAAETETATERD